MRSFAIAVLLPFLVANVSATSPVAESAPVVQQGEPYELLYLYRLQMLTRASFAFANGAVSSSSTAPFDLSFNASSTIRAPKSTMTPRQSMRTEKKRYYWGPTIIQDPEPGDTASQPPIGGGNTTPDASQGLTRPSFPPRPQSSTTSSATSESSSSVSSDPLPSPSSSSSSSSEVPSVAPSSVPTPSTISSPESLPAETEVDSSSSTLAPTSSHFYNTLLAANRSRREKLRVSYTSHLAELSRLSVANAKTQTTSSEKPQWTKIRACTAVLTSSTF
ncbi:uncharacterized protein JCM6883_002432 [Sporobolomyces salmoneus]|uniref:uncharacterized protein n=1 Tax=Sporobolomyces salmoneus TaxID=183962 RepID=UPI003179943C